MTKRKTPPLPGLPTFTPAVLRHLRDLHRSCMLDDTLGEPARLVIKDGDDTAFWYFHAGMHWIVLGTGLVRRVRRGTTEQGLCEWLSDVYHHERAHAHETERDDAVVHDIVRQLKIPFDGFNVCEDLRVEHCYASQQQHAGLDLFAWWKHQSLHAQVEDFCGVAPGMVALCAMQDLGRVRGDLAKLEGGYDEHAHTLERALDYYGQCHRASCSTEAAQVFRRMVDEFPELASFNKNKRPRQSDLGDPRRRSAQRAIAAQGRGIEEAISQAAAAAALADKSDDVRGRSQPADLLADEPLVSIDEARIERLASRWAGIRTSGRHRVAAARRPGPRVSVRHAILGMPRWTQRVATPASFRARRILFVGDTSGSMEGEPQHALATIVASLSKACEMGLIVGDVVLSKTQLIETSGTAARHMRHALPWTVEQAARICTHGGEGLDATLAAVDALVAAADLVVVATDGAIGGPPIRHREYARRGIQVVGVYCTESPDLRAQAVENMQAHFQRIVVRSCVEDVVDALLMQDLAGAGCTDPRTFQAAA